MSFSAIAPVPWIGVPSKVSMDVSRWGSRNGWSVSQMRPSFTSMAHIERGQICPVSVEGSVVKVGELLCDSVDIGHRNRPS